MLGPRVRDIGSSGDCGQVETVWSLQMGHFTPADSSTVVSVWPDLIFFFPQEKPETWIFLMWDCLILKY